MKYFEPFSEDLERTNEISTTLRSRLRENGNRINKDAGFAYQESQKSQKKKVLKELNKIVQKFNENKVKIKDEENQS